MFICLQTMGVATVVMIRNVQPTLINKDTEEYLYAASYATRYCIHGAAWPLNFIWQSNDHWTACRTESDMRGPCSVRMLQTTCQ